ncbi:NYN domain-containing protein [Demequina sp.]|uniref:NYN domain-containing protein n=1 Tax=Demequina sp. TaxID=2050685 RepID=UPI003A8469B8
MDTDRLIVYVDGFNLYHGLHDKWKCQQLWLDLHALATSLRPRSTLLKVNYFTAPVLNDAGAASRQSDYQAALKAHSEGAVDVIQGRYQAKLMTCRTCGATYTRYEEKETDVNIAVRLVSDAAIGRMDSAIIISADSDLAPAIRTARQVNPRLFVAAAFPPKRYSAELHKLMPRSMHIGHEKIRQSQLPETVTDRAGASWSRPTKWGSKQVS